MKKVINKILESKYGWVLPLLDIFFLFALIFGIGFCIDSKNWLLLVGIIAFFIVKCFFLTNRIHKDYDKNFILAINGGTLVCPKCNNETLIHHDHHYYGNSIECTTCDYTKETH